jgi:hypothetical protein
LSLTLQTILFIGGYRVYILSKRRTAEARSNAGSVR